jgi:hypothetical protein
MKPDATPQLDISQADFNEIMDAGSGALEMAVRRFVVGDLDGAVRLLDAADRASDLMRKWIAEDGPTA